MEKMNKHYMYILRCIDGTLYTGYTNDLDKRIATHNKGKGAKYTRNRLPVKCIYFETFERKEEAMSAEYYFKQKNRRQKIEYIKERSVVDDTSSDE
ncbi:MAG: GIY-YIG nuclease family protein [Kurthia sp.]